MNSYREAAALLPLSLCGELLVLPDSMQNEAEEIRLRAGRPVSVLINGTEHVISKGHSVTCDDLYSVLEKATCASVHSVERELSQGYVTAECGIRIGICGTAIYKSGRLSGLKNYSSMSIRIPHEIRGCCREICDELNDGQIKSVLIVSPPGYGKTTFLRDYIRCLSERGVRVSAIDERSELGAVTDGESQYDLGPCTDIMNGVSKAEAAMMVLRAMNPQVIAMDEISEPEDVRAVAAAAGCGIKLLSTAHADGVEDLRRRPIYRELLNLGIFDNAVIIKREEDKRRYIVEALI